MKLKEVYLILDISELSEEEKLEYKGCNFKKKLYDVKTLKEATIDDITFFINTKYKSDFLNTKAGVCILNKKLKDSIKIDNKDLVLIYVKNPHYIYTKILDALFLVPQFIINPKISKKAIIAKTAEIGQNVEIQDGVCIGENVKIGDNCKICYNAVINDNCIIDKNTFIGCSACISYAEIGQYCVIQNNASIGQCGFGFSNNNYFNYKIPQIGLVKIGNFVEIGACTCIDRGAVTDTVIGDCTKIDNLVQIAHGVRIGKGCFFAACTGVAGSTEFGDFVQVGGHSGINGHIKIGTGSMIAGHSGVVQDISPMEKVGGYPAMKLMEWERLNYRLIKFFNNRNKNDR